MYPDTPCACLNIIKYFKMKKLYASLGLSITVLLMSCSSTRTYTQSYPPDNQGYNQGYSSESSSDITYQQFYDGLSPYGNWVDYQNYGYVWMPNEQGFRPYYNNGHWLYTNYGWTWVSNYNWGWAPFHYGRWLYDDAYGWMWLPGYEWAPAWVSWRSGGGCYGWAPMGPDYNFNMGMGSRIPDNYWAFVPNRYINSPRINNYYISREKNVDIINNTTIINNTNVTNNRTVYVTGPSATEVEKVTREKVRPVRIVQKTTPGTEVNGSTLAIYKPAIKPTPQQNQQIRPSKIVNLNDVRGRGQNTGAPATGSRVNEGQGKPVTPAENKPDPAFNHQKTYLPSSGNAAAPDQKPNAATEKQVENQQPPRVIPSNQIFDHKPTIIRRENSNDAQINNQQRQTNTQPTSNDAQINNQQRQTNTQPNPQTNSQQNPQANTQQNNSTQRPVITNRPEKPRVENQPERNREVVPQNNPAPVNREPVRQQRVEREKSFDAPVRSINRQTLSDFQENSRPQVDRSPIIRNRDPAEPRDNRREFPQRDRK